MALTIVFGTAFEVLIAGPDDPRVRDYHTADALYVGHDSLDCFHVCDSSCLASALPSEYIACQDRDDRFVSIHPFRRNGRVMARTADVYDFDPGDDPYILCASCKTELLRDDARFEAEYGHKIGE